MATRTAIVTGGGTGIGAAIARRLSVDGYAVTVMGRRTEPLDEVVEQLGEGLAVTGGDPPTPRRSPRSSPS